MNLRTRNFLIGSAAVVAAGIGTGLIAYYSGGLGVVMGRSSTSDLAYIPVDAVAVGYADVRSVMSSQFRQKVGQLVPTGEETQKIRETLGVDLERDIDTVVAGYMGGESPFRGAVVVVRGRFNDSLIEAQAVQHGATQDTYKGRRLVVMAHQDRDPAVGDQAVTGAVAFLEPGVIALGDLGAIKRAIDTHESGNDVRKSEELRALIADTAGTGNAWFVGSFDGMKQAASLPTEIQNHLPAVQTFAVTALVNGGLRGSVRAEARDDQSAEQLRDIVRGALAAGRLMGGQDQRIETLLSSFQITGAGTTVGLNFAVPTEMLDILNGIAAAHRLEPGIRK